MGNTLFPTYKIHIHGSKGCGGTEFMKNATQKDLVGDREKMSHSYAYLVLREIDPIMSIDEYPDGIIYIVDASDKSTFEQAKKSLRDLKFKYGVAMFVWFNRRDLVPIGEWDKIYNEFNLDDNMKCDSGSLTSSEEILFGYMYDTLMDQMRKQ